jgi:hypothetical protein
VVEQTHEVVSYKWKESLKYDFIDFLNENSSILCVGLRDTVLLQSVNVNNVVNILHFVAERDEFK